jgi:hypothetical protein
MIEEDSWERLAEIFLLKQILSEETYLRISG